MTPRVRDLSPDLTVFLDDVLGGLASPQKTLPCKYFYDERGSALFEEICDLDEYYLTRTELSILRRRVGEMAEALGPECLVVEYGSGASVKTRLLLDALETPVAYVPIDISREHLRDAATKLHEAYPDLEVLPVCADYTERIELPTPGRKPRRTVVYFPGSTLGNFDAGEAIDFLRRLADTEGPGGTLLIGLDLRKSPEILERAYDDPRGVTAEFNRNLLVRINAELGADFDVESFEHRAIWNDEASRMEMHLESTREQIVHVGGETFEFRRGERIWTESSHKYSLEDFAELARQAGFERRQVWMDPEELFSVQLLRVMDGTHV